MFTISCLKNVEGQVRKIWESFFLKVLIFFCKIFTFTIYLFTKLFNSTIEVLPDEWALAAQQNITENRYKALVKSFTKPLFTIQHQKNIFVEKCKSFSGSQLTQRRCPICQNIIHPASLLQVLAQVCASSSIIIHKTLSVLTQVSINASSLQVKASYFCNTMSTTRVRLQLTWVVL